MDSSLDPRVIGGGSKLQIFGGSNEFGASKTSLFPFSFQGLRRFWLNHPNSDCDNPSARSRSWIVRRIDAALKDDNQNDLQKRSRSL